MKHLPFVTLLFIACSTSTNEVDIPNPFESEYIIDAVTSDLNGVSIYTAENSSFYIFTIETDCDDTKSCPTTDLFIHHNFNENRVFTKDFGIRPISLSDVLLFPEGKCSVPFAANSGTLQINRLEDGSFTGVFNVESREINGYSPDSRIGCSEDYYSTEGVRTLSFEGSFTSFEAE